MPATSLRTASTSTLLQWWMWPTPALLEKHRTNLALARFQLLEVERSLP